MSKDQSLKLEADIGELSDIRNARMARDKRQNEDAVAAQIDIKMLIMMSTCSVTLTDKPNTWMQLPRIS